MTTAFKKELYNEDLVYSSVVFGMGFWIDDQGLFISAPEFKDGSLDIDNAIPVYDWENFSELNRTSSLTLNACKPNVHTEKRFTTN